VAASEPDPAVEELVRQLYWHGGATRATQGSVEVRDRLLEFAGQMRVDQQMKIPYGEPTLAARTRPRRRLKFAIFRALRPLSWRYDRLLADLADLTVRLAEELIVAEGEIARLRERVEGGASPEGRAVREADGSEDEDPR
jgi:hypothetical protein